MIVAECKQLLDFPVMSKSSLDFVISGAMKKIIGNQQFDLDVFSLQFFEKLDSVTGVMF